MNYAYFIPHFLEDAAPPVNRVPGPAVAVYPRTANVVYALLGAVLGALRWIIR